MQPNMSLIGILSWVRGMNIAALCSTARFQKILPRRDQLIRTPYSRPSSPLLSEVLCEYRQSKTHPLNNIETFHNAMWVWYILRCLDSDHFALMILDVLIRFIPVQRTLMPSAQITSSVNYSVFTSICSNFAHKNQMKLCVSLPV